MKKRITLATAFLFTCSAFLFGQNTFTKTYGLPPTYEGLEDIVEANGRYYGLGSKYSGDADHLDMYLVVLSPDGELIDEFTFGLGDARIETGQRIIALSDGLLLLGQVTDLTTFQADLLALKVGFDGQLAWTAVYGAPNLVETFGDAAAQNGEGSVLLIGTRERGTRLLYYVEIDAAGNLLAEVETSIEVAGNNQLAITNSDGGWYIGYTSERDQYITKLDNNLQPEWQITDFGLGINTADDIRLLLELNNGNLLTGYEIRGSTAIIVITPDGSLAAEGTLASSASGTLYPSDAIQLENGNILLAARPANDYSSGSEILEINTDGEELGRQALNNALNQVNAIIPATSGILLAGTSFVNQGGADARAVALTEALEIQWTVTAGAAGRYGEERGYGIIEGDDGSFYILSTETLAPGQDDLTLTRVNANGNILWQSTLGTEDTDRPASLALTADGQVALFGYRLIDSGYRIVVYKVSTDGQLIWEAVYNPQAPLQAFRGGILALPDGSLVAGCHTLSREMLLIRFSPEGNIQWVHQETPELEDQVLSLFCYEIDLSSDGNILVAGGVSLANSRYGAVVLKYDSATGNPIWPRFLERETLARAYSLATDEDGAIYGLGWQLEGLFFTRILFKLSETGDSLWFKAPPIESLDFIGNYSIAEAPGKKMMAISTTRETEPINSISYGRFTSLVSLFDDEGEELWRRTLAPAYSTVLYDGISTSDGGFAIVGYTHNTQTSDTWLIKLAADGTVNTQVPLKPELQLRLFPNPAGEVLQVELGGAARGTLQAVLYDTQGQQLRAWPFEKSGETRVESLDVHHLPAGAYFLSLVVDGVRYGRQWVKR